MRYENLVLALTLDLVAIFILVAGVYFPRHQRRDLLLPFVAVNVGLFAVAVFVADQELNLAVGLGLFALLSVVRLRSSQIAQEDIGYYFIALVLGLINGLARDGQWAQIVTLNVILVLTMYVADHPRILGGRQQLIVTLDEVYTSERALREAIEERLHAHISRVVVQQIDLARGHMVVDVRLRTRPPKRGHDRR